MDSKGVPTSYKVQTLSISDLKASSVEALMDSMPLSADTRAVLGHGANLTHDLVMDIAFSADTNFIKKFKKDEDAKVLLLFGLLKDFYKNKNFPKDSLDVEEDIDVQISWILHHGRKQKFADSLSKISDSAWYASLQDWEDAIVSDTTFKINLSELDSSVTIDLPSQLVDSLKNTERYTRLQMRLSTPKASRVYRFYGEDTEIGISPFLTLYADSSYLSFKPNRMANIMINEEECAECPILHGGAYDSLVVEIPPEPILKALSDFYGDDFPVSADEEFDVRQSVILAELTVARDDSKGTNELGLPIQVVAGSFVDSADGTIRKMENYRVKRKMVVVDGHQNLLFHDGDSLKVQLTYGLRDFLNRAEDGRGLKFMIRIGLPYLQEKDSTNADYIDEKTGDTCLVRMYYFDYARYDFSTVLEGPMTLKLWLASKRDFKGEDE